MSFRLAPTIDGFWFRILFWSFFNVPTSTLYVPFLPELHPSEGERTIDNFPPLTAVRPVGIERQECAFRTLETRPGDRVLLALFRRMLPYPL